MFFQLIDRRYEKKSTIVTSNINLSDWNQIFVDNMLASAILDRLVHHSNIVNILGNSYRTATALSKISDKNNLVDFVHKILAKLFKLILTLITKSSTQWME